MHTPLVTEVEILYDRESESPLPERVVDLTFTKEGKKARKAPEVPVLGDGLDLDDPMVSHYADTGVSLDEKAAMDPSNILNGEDRLRHSKDFSSQTYEDEGLDEDDLPICSRDEFTGESALQLTE